MTIDWDDDCYTDFLTLRKDKIFYVYPYRGNSGDVLILKGTLGLLKKLQIKTTVDPRKAQIIIWPGGNPTMWASNIKGWSDLLQRYTQAEFIVGPATFQFSELPWQRVLTTYGKNVGAIFARDPESYDVIREAGLPAGISVGLSHDPAFFLWDAPWMKEHRDAATEEYILIAMRDDHEAALSHLHSIRKAVKRLLPAKIDNYWDTAVGRLSSVLRAGKVRKSFSSATSILIRDAAKDNFNFFLETVRRAGEVHTDRLHIMVLAMMLGKKVSAYNTSYNKLEAVYDHSCRASHADIVFVRHM